MFAFVWLTLSVYASLVSTAATVPNNNNNDSPPSSQPLHIFLLAGQSNMSGRGGVINATWDGIIPPESRSKSSAILRLNAEDTWVDANEPLHKDIDVKVVCGVGPGMAFANSVKNKDPSFGMIGLVPCAVGGTKISEWGRGTTLYDRLVRRAKAALQTGGTVRALLWYQGEADTVDHVDARLYKLRLKQFFTDLRTDLQLLALPVIQVGLASGQGQYVRAIREAQFGINVPNVKTVDAAGLALEPDRLHLSTPAQVQLGEMLADTFLQSEPLPAPVLSSSNALRIIPRFGLGFLLGPFRQFLYN